MPRTRRLAVVAATTWSVAAAVAGVRATVRPDWSGPEAGVLPWIQVGLGVLALVPAVVVVRLLLGQHPGRPTAAFAWLVAAVTALFAVDVVQRAHHDGALVVDIALPNAVLAGAIVVAVAGRRVSGPGRGCRGTAR